MQSKYTRFNDGSSNPPRLRTHQALWGLIGLPMNTTPEWSLDEKFERVKASGFEAVECWLSDENEKEVTEALKRHDLRLVMGHRPFKLNDVRQTVERAARLKADFVFCQPADAYTPVEDVATLVQEGQRIASDHGLPFFVEVHRNNFTETLPQTRQLIERVPEIRFTADLSHFVVVGEFYGWEGENALERMLPIIERTSHAHGRISNGEAVQVDVGDGSGPTAQFFVQLWAEAMRHWLKGAGPGDIFPLASELGPPRYAITLPDGREFSDRWKQGLVMKRLAEMAWNLANEKS